MTTSGTKRYPIPYCIGSTQSPIRSALPDSSPERFHPIARHIDLCHLSCPAGSLSSASVTFHSSANCHLLSYLCSLLFTARSTRTSLATASGLGLMTFRWSQKITTQFPRKWFPLHLIDEKIMEDGCRHSAIDVNRSTVLLLLGQKHYTQLT